MYVCMYVCGLPTLCVDKESQTLQGATERRGKVEPEKGMYTYVYCVCVLFSAFCKLLYDVLYFQISLSLTSCLFAAGELSPKDGAKAGDAEGQI